MTVTLFLLLWFFGPLLVAVARAWWIRSTIGLNRHRPMPVGDFDRWEAEL